MADFNESMKILMELEFSNPKNALHKNKTENGYTYMGIYQTAHPNWSGWLIVSDFMKKYKEIAIASQKLMEDALLTKLVYMFYKKNFWDIARLDSVFSQHNASEIFVFGVNAGMGVAVKAAQRVIGASLNGKMDTETLEKLNKFQEKVFDEQYDLMEQEHYNRLIAKNPKLKIYANGWRNRSVAV